MPVISAFFDMPVETARIAQFGKQDYDLIAEAV
jgi:hypothetical protein